MTTALQYETFESNQPMATVGPFRAEDYLALPEGEPVQLLRGRLILSPSPNSSHQVIVTYFAGFFLDFQRRHGGVAMVGPTDVVLSDHTIVVPDMVYVVENRRDIVREGRIHGPPDVVVEVLSPGNFKRDTVEKLDLYRQYGTAEYWIVDRLKRTVHFYILNEGEYAEVDLKGSIYRSPMITDLVFDTAEFWSEVSDRID